MKDQTDVGAISQELDTAEGYYRGAKYHMILCSDGVLARAWCLYEAAIRREAKKRSELVFVRGFDGLEADLNIKQVEAIKLDMAGLLDCIYERMCGVSLCSTLLITIFNVFCRLEIKFIEEFTSYSSTAIQMACGKEFKFYEEMEAFKDSDKEGIKSKIDDVF
jgi:hypothetical protein